MGRDPAIGNVKSPDLIIILINSRGRSKPHESQCSDRRRYWHGYGAGRAGLQHQIAYMKFRDLTCWSSLRTMVCDRVSAAILRLVASTSFGADRRCSRHGEGERNAHGAGDGGSAMIMY